MGDSTQLHPGQTVLAFGNPLGFRFTVTRGIVSALNRPNPFAADRRSPGQFIQTDAAINPGNSGGPLVNAHGEVVGINTFLVSETGGFSGMGFAIPTQIVKPTVDSLIKYGKVNHGYIGIGINDVTPEEAKFFHVNNASGAVVTQVEPNSPGAKAGLQSRRRHHRDQRKDRERCRRAAGRSRTKSSPEPRCISRPCARKFHRGPGHAGGDGQRRARQPKLRSQHTASRAGDLGLGDLTPDLRQQLQAGDDVHGAVIQQVIPGSPADNAGLQQGDVITEVESPAGAFRSRCAESTGQRSQGQRCTGAGLVQRRKHVPRAASDAGLVGSDDRRRERTSRLIPSGRGITDNGLVVAAWEMLDAMERLAACITLGADKGYQEE